MLMVLARRRADTARLSAALILLIAGIAGAYLLEVSFLLRMLGAISCIVLAGLLTYRTELGKFGWGFLHQTQLEVKKMVWPERPQAVQMTLFVLIMVILVALILWLLDWILGGLVEALLG